MPRLVVEAPVGTLSSKDRRAIKEVLKRECPNIFSVSGRTLTADDFTVVFPVLEPESDVTHDIIVRAELHADAERLDRMEVDAQYLAHMLDTVVNTFNVVSTGLTKEIGVSLLYGTIAWATAGSDT